MGLANVCDGHRLQGHGFKLDLDFKFSLAYSHGCDIFASAEICSKCAALERQMLGLELAPRAKKVEM